MYYQFRKPFKLIKSNYHFISFTSTTSPPLIKPLPLMSNSPSQLRFIDIGSNLSDPVFRGIYHQKQSHPNDFDQIITRARQSGVSHQILTGDCLNGSSEVLQLTQTHHGFYATIGCHPCRADEFESSGNSLQYLNSLRALIEADQQKDPAHRRVVAVGECGLDYDRLSYCSKEIQLRHFPPQLDLASEFKLPLFLHSRTSEAHIDLVRILREHPKPLLPPRRRGVVHSFTGTRDEMEELISLGYSIGLNGCSLKTVENLSVVKHVPLDRLLLETDCPWCDIRASHASYAYLSDLPPSLKITSIKKERHTPDDGKMVKGRNEPCTMAQVAWVVAKLLEIPFEELVEEAWKNSVEMFGLEDGV